MVEIDIGMIKVIGQMRDLLRMANSVPANPRIVRVQVWGSGTAVVVTLIVQLSSVLVLPDDKSARYNVHVPLGFVSSNELNIAVCVPVKADGLDCGSMSSPSGCHVVPFKL
jgi:hypothetical protein